MRRAKLERLVAQKREVHPELRRPLTWARLHTVCKRERIALCLADLPLEQPAQLVPFFDRWSILVSDDLAPRERVRLAAHELGHVWAHHDLRHERWEVVYHAGHSEAHDPEEREAEAIAWLLIEAASELPGESRPAPRHVALVVPAAFDPYDAPAAIAQGRPAPRYGAGAGETRLQQAMRLARPLRREMKDGPASDHGIVEHSPGRVRYTDRDGVRWTVWDIIMRDGVRSIVPGGAAGARLRHFVNVLGAQRTYQFTNKRELRDVAERHLERQLREASPVPLAASTRQRAAGE